MCQIYSKLTIKTPKQCLVSIKNFDISHTLFCYYWEKNCPVGWENLLD